MSTERRIAKNAAWLALQPLAMNVVSLAATGYIAQKLGAAEMGQFNLGYAFIAVFVPLSNLGIRTVTVRTIARNRDMASEFLGRVLVLRALLALASAGVAVMAAPLSGGSESAQAVITIAALGMLISTAVGVLTDGFEAFERMRSSSVACFLGGLLLTVASVVVVWSGGGIRELALAYVLGPLCTLCLLVLRARRMPFFPRLSWDPRGFGRLLQEASPFMAVILVDIVSTRLDILILARLVEESELGHYGAATALVDRAMYIAQGASSALLPALAAMTARTTADAVPLLRKSIIWLMALCVPIALVTTALSPWVIGVIFGSQYSPAGPILAVGIWRLPLACLIALEMQCLNDAGRPDLFLRTCAMMTIVHFASLFPLVYYWGLPGAQMAVLLKCVLMILTRISTIERYFPGIWPWRKLLCLATALVLMSVPLVFVPFSRSLIGALGLLLVSLGVYAAGLWLLQVIPVVEMLRSICNRRRAVDL